MRFLTVYHIDICTHKLLCIQCKENNNDLKILKQSMKLPDTLLNNYREYIILEAYSFFPNYINCQLAHINEELWWKHWHYFIRINIAYKCLIELDKNLFFEHKVFFKNFIELKDKEFKKLDYTDQSKNGRWKYPKLTTPKVKNISPWEFQY
jgi:hypothetical protein